MYVIYHLLYSNHPNSSSPYNITNYPSLIIMYTSFSKPCAHNAKLLIINHFFFCIIDSGSRFNHSHNRIVVINEEPHCRFVEVGSKLEVCARAWLGVQDRGGGDG